MFKHVSSYFYQYSQQFPVSKEIEQTYNMAKYNEKM